MSLPENPAISLSLSFGNDRREREKSYNFIHNTFKHEILICVKGSVAFTWIQADGRWTTLSGRHGKDKQLDGMAGWQNEKFIATSP